MVKKVVKVTTKRITAGVASKVLEVVDAGLSSGLGSATPGDMCVEAAVCYAMGEPHTDRPICVLPAIRDTKISINDSGVWADLVGDGWGDSDKTKKLRAEALRRLAIAQLGSKSKISRSAWEAALKEYVAKLPAYREEAAQYKKDAARIKKEIKARLAGLDKGEGFDTYELNLDSLSVSTDPDDFFCDFKSIKAAKKVCEDLVQILVKLKSPGTKFLYLTEKPKAKGKKAKVVKKVSRKKRAAKK